MNIEVMRNNLKIFIGIPVKCLVLIESLSKHTHKSERDIIICLRKMKLNESFEILAKYFNMTRQNVGRIFNETIKPITRFLRAFIKPSTKDKQLKYLPKGFRLHYSKVCAIIDGMEIQIEKPEDPKLQSLTYSQYKKCNTKKYLIVSTADGHITFVSKGFGGRTSDKELTLKSGFVDTVPVGASVMADRGFKNLYDDFAIRKILLIKPSSVATGKQLSKNNATESKQIAGLRIMIERVIGDIRQFDILKPHAVVDTKLRIHMDDILVCVSAIANINNTMIYDGTENSEL